MDWCNSLLSISDSTCSLYFSITIHDTSFLFVSTRRYDLPCAPAICRCPPLCHFGKCIYVVIVSLFITLKLEFTEFSISFSIKEAREEGSGSLKILAFFGIFNYRLQADQEHQWNGGMGSGPSPWTATSRIHTHALYMQWFHCTFPWCHSCSQLSTTELCCKRQQGTHCLQKHNGINLQCYWRTENRKQNMIGLCWSGWKSLPYYNPNWLQQ